MLQEEATSSSSQQQATEASSELHQKTERYGELLIVATRQRSFLVARWLPEGAAKQSIVDFFVMPIFESVGASWEGIDDPAVLNQIPFEICTFRTLFFTQTTINFTVVPGELRIGNLQLLVKVNGTEDRSSQTMPSTFRIFPPL